VHAHPAPAGSFTGDPPEPSVVGAVGGRVTDAREATGLAGATVTIEGSRLSATTGPDGRYVIPNVPAGSHVIVARGVGYAAARQSVTVIDDQQATADFALQRAAVPLDEIVVTGTAGGEQRRAAIRCPPSTSRRCCSARLRRTSARCSNRGCPA
jgi:hypothetical protein